MAQISHVIAQCRDALQGSIDVIRSTRADTGKRSSNGNLVSLVARDREDI